MLNRAFPLIAAILAVVLVGTGQGPSVGAATVYSNDLESNTNGFNSSSRSLLPTNATGTTTSQFLGRFSNDAVTLRLTGLAAGTTYNVAFDLFIGTTWDGNAELRARPVAVAGESALVNTTFLNILPSDGILNNFTQDYSDTNPIGAGTNPAYTGADVAHGGRHPGQIRDLRLRPRGGNPLLSFTATSSAATLSFAGSSLQGVADESWALDNLLVESVAAVIPEPWGLVLLGTGLCGLSAGIRGAGAAAATSA